MGQVEEAGGEVLAHRLKRGFGLTKTAVDQIMEYLALETDTEYLVPLKSSLDIGPLAHRLALIERIVHLEWDGRNAETMVLLPDGEFWRVGGNSSLPYGRGSTDAERALLNSNHPYQMGLVYSIDEGSLVDLGTGNAITDPSLGPSHPVPTTFWTCGDDVDDDEVEATLRRVASWCPPGTRLKNQPTPMMELGIETDALTAGGLVVKLELSEGGLQPARFVDIADGFGLSLHQFLRIHEMTYLGFKKHPRDDELDSLGPVFEGRREIRRLRETQFARTHFRGHKGPQGERETSIAELDGWRVLARRPGFKDSDDFIALLEGPGGDRQNIYAEGRPNFEEIFKEAMWNLHCPQSGLPWLQAVWRLWNGEADPSPFIERTHRTLPACVYEGDLNYPRGPFLWLLHLIFIEEDINYRFFYHKTGFRAPLYRKQGRDMPMNGILTVAALPLSEDVPREVAEGAKTQRQMIPRPVLFEGPGHLEGWYGDHVIRAGGQ